MKLKHVILYSKGWYKRTDNVWNDLKNILVLDGYTPVTNSDIFKIIINNLPDNYPSFDPKRLIFAIDPYDCWKFGYVVKGDSFFKGNESYAVEYDYCTSVIFYVLSELRFMERDWYDFLPKPIYSHINKKPKDVKQSMLKEQFGC